MLMVFDIRLNIFNKAQASGTVEHAMNTLLEKVKKQYNPLSVPSKDFAYQSEQLLDYFTLITPVIL